MVVAAVAADNRVVAVDSKVAVVVDSIPAEGLVRRWAESQAHRWVVVPVAWWAESQAHRWVVVLVAWWAEPQAHRWVVVPVAWWAEVALALASIQDSKDNIQACQA
jgi:hypothetical protein